MKFSVFELASKYVYPSIRRRIVEIMYKEIGLSQKQISKIMYIDQSTVARYLEGERGKYIDLSIYPELDKVLKKYAIEITSVKPDKYTLTRKLIRLTLWILGRGYICPYHEKLDNTIDASKCKICIELFKNIELDDESHGREK